jgi:hypothetical protein
MIMFGFVYMFIFLIYLPHMKVNMQPLSFWTWLNSLNRISSSCIRLPSNCMVFFFLCGWVKCHFIYLYIPHFLDPLISCRASELFPQFGYCELCCNKHSCAMSLLHPELWSFGYVARSSITGSYGSSNVILNSGPCAY